MGLVFDEVPDYYFKWSDDKYQAWREVKLAADNLTIDIQEWLQKVWVQERDRSSYDDSHIILDWR